VFEMRIGEAASLLPPELLQIHRSTQMFFCLLPQRIDCRDPLGAIRVPPVPQARLGAKQRQPDL